MTDSKDMLDEADDFVVWLINWRFGHNRCCSHSNMAVDVSL